MTTLKIGPAGLGPIKTAEKVLEEYKKQGFEHCEIAFTRGPYIKEEEDARRIGKKAKELGITFSIHAPYFVNLNSAEKEKVETSKKRILSCCKVGEWLGAKYVVFHAGYYGQDYAKQDSEKQKKIAKITYENIRDAIKDMMRTIKGKKWKILIAPETMGKVNVFGSIDEISNLVKDTGCSFCIDFAHILARDKKVDFDKIKKLFPQKTWHCHFSGIVYGEKGEKHHKKTLKSEWKEVFENLPKGNTVHLACESPTMHEDCVEALEVWNKVRS